MGSHNFALFGRQLTSLQQNVVRYSNLADVVQRCGPTNQLDVACASAQFLGDIHAQS